MICLLLNSPDPWRNLLKLVEETRGMCEAQPMLFNRVQQIKYAHSWHGSFENDPRQNIAQLWKLFSYITIMIFKISFRNCVSSLLSPHYRTFLFTGPFDLNKAQTL